MTVPDAAIAVAIGRRVLPALLTGLLLLGSPPVDAKVVETDNVTLDVPSNFQVSKSSRGIKLQTSDQEVFAWFETYKLSEQSKVLQDYNEYWKKNGVVLNTPSVRDVTEPGGPKQEATDFKNATWKGKPTVLRYISIGPTGSDDKMVLFTLWASPDGFGKYGQDVLAVLKSVELKSGTAGPAPAQASGAQAAAPAPATLADLEAQEKATAAIWERLPFSTRHAMFVTRKADAYGDYEARPSNVFAPGEKLLSYIEPLGYAWAAQGDGYRFGVSLDFEILGKGGEVLGGQKGILKQEFASRYRNREFFLNSTMSLDGAPAGEYVLAYTLHDLGSGRTVRVEQPFRIKAAAEN